MRNQITRKKTINSKVTQRTGYAERSWCSAFSILIGDPQKSALDIRRRWLEGLEFKFVTLWVPVN